MFLALPVFNYTGSSDIQNNLFHALFMLTFMLALSRADIMLTLPNFANHSTVLLTQGAVTTREPAHTTFACPSSLWELDVIFILLDPQLHVTDSSDDEGAEPGSDDEEGSDGEGASSGEEGEAQDSEDDEEKEEEEEEGRRGRKAGARGKGKGKAQSPQPKLQPKKEGR